MKGQLCIMISIDGITMKKMGENSPVRVWLKYKELADKLDTSGIYAIKLCEEIVYVLDFQNIVIIYSKERQQTKLAKNMIC